MHRAVLLAKQPVEDAPALLGAHHLVNARAERVDGERRHPRRKVRVNRPAPVGTHGLEQKLDSVQRDGMVSIAAAREAHGDETGQRRGFEEPAIRRLDALQHAQGLGPRAVSQQSRDWVARGQVMVPHLSDGNERGQRVTHNRQAQRGEELVRQRGQLEGKLNDALPSRLTLAESPGQRAHREDGDGERAVIAIAGDDGGDERGAVEPGRVFSIQCAVFSGGCGRRRLRD